MEGSPNIVAALVTACLLLLVNGEPVCDPSWIRFHDHCYKIISGNYTRPSSVRQIPACGDHGDLAAVPDISVLDFLAQHAAHAESSKFWVGLKRRSDGHFYWVTGEGDVKEQPWVRTDGYEDIRPWTHDVQEGCFAYDGAAVRYNPCDEKIGIICSKNIYIIGPQERCRQDKNSYVGKVTGNCIFGLSEETTRDNAKELCHKEGAYFVDADDLFREGALDVRRAVFSEHKYWTMLTLNGTHLLWPDGSKVSQERSIPFQAGSGSCVTLMFKFKESNKGVLVQFHQTECDALAMVLCSEPAGGFTTAGTTPAPPANVHAEPQMDDPYLSCPNGYNWKSDRANRYCYWETSFETEQLSWNEAELYCQAFGGHLSSFHSQEEEKIGLSFQYGSLAHPYWIGLKLDVENETYRWIDGTPLDYQNWASGHPNHKDKQLQCVAMDAQAKYWVSSLCGILSWFICKVPAKSSHPAPVLPTPIPLEPCDKSSSISIPSIQRAGPTGSMSQEGPPPPALFKGDCYFVVTETVNWHRAKQYCENEGASLVSIHSGEEIGFLLKLLHDSPAESSRVWIGLNSFGSDGNFRWTDWSGMDFTFFAENEPNNFQNQEKCVNMDIKNGEWSDENCNAVMGFICKRRNDTSDTTIVPSTVDPRIGNCKKGWIAHHDRCYYLGGKREKDRVNWTEALDICQKHGGYLTSIRDETDQSFLSYLLQTLGGDAWIGLHDTIQSGRYYWLDNSEVRYTNWAPGEPSIFGVMEDCVKLVYDHLDSGVWKDEECGRRLRYICQNDKDPGLPPAPYERGINCLHPEGWLKLDNMCFKMFEGNTLTWERAEDACQKEGAHLVSIFDQRVKAVASYLAVEVNQPFFIGLKYEKESQRIRWLNGHSALVTNWEKNEPSFLTEETCFASTSEGYWTKTSCQDEMPFVCQMTTGKQTRIQKYTGNCPPSSMKWISGSSSYCYILDDQDRYDWFTANLMCFRYGSHLASIHSLREIEDLKKLMKPGIRSVYIGLMRNKKGGFTWMDDSPVDFVNWEDLEPSNSGDQCVEMMADSMKWKVSPCISKKHFICKDRKGTLVLEEPQSAEFVGEKSGLSTSAICAVVASILIGVILIVAAAIYRRRSSSASGTQFRRQFRDHSVSFENALYNVGSASMEFHDEPNSKGSL